VLPHQVAYHGFQLDLMPMRPVYPHSRHVMPGACRWCLFRFLRTWSGRSGGLGPEFGCEAVMWSSYLFFRLNTRRCVLTHLHLRISKIHEKPCGVTLFWGYLLWVEDATNNASASQVIQIM
jgi:hypothetical protein